MKVRSRLRFVLEGVEGLLVFAAVFVSWPISKRWLADWGATSEEREQAWPGDGRVAPVALAHTRAIAIDARAEAVWPWIAQLGLGRAGFYSYELLERLVGIPVTNVESIEPGLQKLEVGGEVALHPRAPGIPVALLEPGRRVCFGRLPATAPAGEDPFGGRSWSIYVEPVETGSCRLIVRSCFDGTRGRWVAALEDPVDFVMEQRMLRTVRRLAEASRA